MVYKWRVIITSTQLPDYVWRTEDQGAPVVGSGGEAIDTSKSKIIDVISDTQIEIKEQKILVNGDNIRLETLKVSTNAGNTSTTNFSWPYDINILSSTSLTKSTMVGSTIDWYVGPTTIGAITANVSINDTVINVSPTVMSYINIGYYLTLTDGITSENLGQVIDIDTDNSQITVETAATSGWNATTPTYVQMTVYFVRNAICPQIDTKISIGRAKIGTSHFPANTMLTCKFTNNTLVNHDMYSYVEFMY